MADPKFIEIGRRNDTMYLNIGGGPIREWYDPGYPAGPECDEASYEVQVRYHNPNSPFGPYPAHVFKGDEAMTVAMALQDFVYTPSVIKDALRDNKRAAARRPQHPK